MKYRIFAIHESGSCMLVIGCMLIVALVLLALAGCFNTTASRLLMESADEEREWFSSKDPRIPGQFSMPISYNPVPPQIGDVRDLTVHIRYGDAIPFTEFMTLRIAGGIELIGEEGVDFFHYTPNDEERVKGSLGSPQWFGGPNYYFRIPPSRIIPIQFRVIGESDDDYYRLDFLVRFTREDTPKTVFGDGTFLTFYPPDFRLLRGVIPSQCRPSQWDLFSEEFLATLDYKPADTATVPPKTRLYNATWNWKLASTRGDTEIAELWDTIVGAMYNEIYPSGKAFHEEFKYSYNLGYFAIWAFPNDYPPEKMTRLFPETVLEGEWPD